MEFSNPKAIAYDRKWLYIVMNGYSEILQFSLTTPHCIPTPSRVTFTVQADFFHAPCYTILFSFDNTLDCNYFAFQFVLSQGQVLLPIAYSAWQLPVIDIQVRLRNNFTLGNSKLAIPQLWCFSCIISSRQFQHCANDLLQINFWYIERMISSQIA
jgi:hypothetical protein